MTKKKKNQDPIKSALRRDVAKACIPDGCKDGVPPGSGCIVSSAKRCCDNTGEGASAGYDSVSLSSGPRHGGFLLLLAAMSL